MLQGEHSVILSTPLSYHLSLRSLFCLLLSGCFTQVLLYCISLESVAACNGHFSLAYVRENVVRSNDVKTFAS